jgi:ribosomal protein S18 acetylase RimI-like enzyme
MTEQHRRLIQQGDRMQIRTASASDAAEIAHVHCAAINVAYSNLWPADELAWIFADFPGRVEAWRDHLGEGPSTALVAEVDGVIVGVVEFEPWEDEVLPETEVDGDIADAVDFEPWEDEGTPWTVAEVTNLSVDPVEWGRGIGEALMREAMARLRDDGRVEVVLWVRDVIRPAVALFERLGFKFDGAVIRTEMYGNLVDRMRLRRPLGEPE